jgi:hypothetical protein
VEGLVPVSKLKSESLNGRDGVFCNRFPGGKW